MLINWEFLLAEIWGLMAIAALIMLITCWFAWGRQAVRARVERVISLERELKAARMLLTQSRADVQRAERKQEDLKDRLAREQAKHRNG